MSDKSPLPPLTVPPNIATLSPYVPGKPIEEVQRELGLSQVIKLASNENPLGPSPRGLLAAQAALAEVHRYPDGGAHDLRAALARHHGVTPAEIVVGNGSAELIELLIRTLLVPGSQDEVIAGDPSFPVYSIEAQAHGVAFVPVPLTAGFGYPVDAILRAASDRTRICFIANPNNPTGTYLPVAGLERLARELPPHVLLVLDEAYFEYATAEDFPNGAALRPLRERMVVLRTFSKAYGLAGLRIGYAIAPVEIAGYLERVRPAFNTSSVAQRAAAAALEDVEHLRRCRETNRKGLAFLEQAFEGLGIRWWPSQANFLLIDPSERGRTGAPPRDAATVYEALLQQGIIVRPAGKRFLRVTAGVPEENERLVRALEEMWGRPSQRSPHG